MILWSRRPGGHEVAAITLNNASEGHPHTMHPELQPLREDLLHQPQSQI